MTQQYKQSGKYITITTSRMSAESFNPFDHYASEHVPLRAIISKITFSEPVMDFKGKDNKNMRLRTAYFAGSCQQNFFCMSILDNEEGYSIIEQRFSKLPGDLQDHSSERLQNWQEGLIQSHRVGLERIENLYWRNEMIPKDFFSFLEENVLLVI